MHDVMEIKQRSEARYPVVVRRKRAETTKSQQPNLSEEHGYDKTTQGKIARGESASTD